MNMLINLFLLMENHDEQRFYHLSKPSRCTCTKRYRLCKVIPSCFVSVSPARWTLKISFMHQNGKLRMKKKITARIIF